MAITYERRDKHGPCGRSARSIIALAAAAGALALFGCGGGGGTAAAPEAPTTTTVGVTVIDGAIQNATVCLDKNLNSACDADEPSARTDAAGNATLEVDEADVGKYPVVAVVGTDAVDADHGPITTPFTLKAPADQPAVISPLTTLVQTSIETTGVSTAEAEAAVQARLGMNVSLFTDFTKDNSTEGATLGAMARLIVVTTQEQTRALEDSVGTEAIDGSIISAADIDEIIRRRLMEIVPVLVNTLADPAVQAAIATGDPTQIETALTPKVAAVVASTNLTSDTIGTVVGIANQSTAPEPAPSGASLALAGLDFIDTETWFRRAFTSSAAQNVPDASGNTRFIDRRVRSFAGVITNWSAGGSPGGQSDTHWDGSAWANCPIGAESTQPPRDASGRTTYDYCHGRELGTSVRAAFDIGGKRMIDIYNQARSAGYTNLTIRGDAAAKLGSAVFPTGSKLFYQTSTATTVTTAYIPTLTNVVRVLNSAGLVNGTAEACDAVRFDTPYGSYTKEAKTLEDVVASVRGNPCKYPVIEGSGPRNEWWSNLFIGQIPGTSSMPYYTGNTVVTVAFGDNNAATYYACAQRASDGSTRNCDPIGTGTYTITTLGDARVLSLANAPVQAAVFPERLFVERAGRVHYGYKMRPSANLSARLNLPAANALFATLGLSPIDPESGFAPTPATYQGDWLITLPGVTTDHRAITLDPTFDGTNGYACNRHEDLGTAGVPFACTVTLNAVTGDFTVVAPGEGTVSGKLSLGTARFTGTFTPEGGGGPITLDGGRVR